jgi:hypothetical protein
MKRHALLPLIVLAFAACSSDTATGPKSVQVSRPALAVLPGFYAGTLLEAFAPSGAHLQTGTIGCTVNADLSIFCGAYEFAGVGHTNIALALAARYTATIDCNNPSASNRNNPIESHTADFVAATPPLIVASTKNGRLSVPSRSVSPFSAPQVCPNDSWVPEIREGTLTLVGFLYTVLFEGFLDPDDAVRILQGTI